MIQRDQLDELAGFVGLPVIGQCGACSEVGTRRYPAIGQLTALDLMQLSFISCNRCFTSTEGGELE